jgi:hypothetical protein
MDDTGRRTEAPTTTSCEHWEAVSAALDGELDASAHDAALAHARRCASCTAMLDLLGATAPKPTPLDTIALTPRERRWLDGRRSRWLLTFAAVVIVATAVPAYVRGEGLSVEAHAARHLASWQIGFGVGVFVAALLARMSHAMLALAATFALLTVAATAIDVIGGHQGPLAESVHLVELVAVFLLWRVAPTHLLPWSRTPPPVRDDRSNPAALHLVRPRPDDSDEPPRS